MSYLCHCDQLPKGHIRFFECSNECSWTVEFRSIVDDEWKDAFPLHRFTLEHAIRKVVDGSPYTSAIHMARAAKLDAHWRLRNLRTHEIIPGEAIGELPR